MSNGREETKMLFTDEFSYSDKCSSYSSIYEESEANLVGEFSKIVENSSSPVITIADFGTADGKMIIPTMNKFIDIVNSDKRMKREIVIYFEDQASNDFNVLCRTVRGNETKEGLNIENGNVFWMVVTESMFNQCLPYASLDFALSFSSIHWMSQRVTTISKGVEQTHANAEELKLLEQQSAKDWNRFLEVRAEELKQGGVIFLSCFVKNTNDANVAKSVEERIHALLLKSQELRKEKLITDEEFRDINFDWYFRTTEELERPFLDGSMQSAGLKMLSIRLYNCTLIPPLDSDQQQDPMKRRQHARSIAEYLKAVTFNSVVSGLSNGRSDKEKTTIANLYFQKIEEYYFENQTYAELKMPIAEVIIKKGEYLLNRS